MGLSYSQLMSLLLRCLVVQSRLTGKLGPILFLGNSCASLAKCPFWLTIANPVVTWRCQYLCFHGELGSRLCLSWLHPRMDQSVCLSHCDLTGFSWSLGFTSWSGIGYPLVCLRTWPKKILTWWLAVYFSWLRSPWYELKSWRDLLASGPLIPWAAPHT